MWHFSLIDYYLWCLRSIPGTDYNWTLYKQRKLYNKFNLLNKCIFHASDLRLITKSSQIRFQVCELWCTMLWCCLITNLDSPFHSFIINVWNLVNFINIYYTKPMLLRHELVNRQTYPTFEKLIFQLTLVERGTYHHTKVQPQFFIPDNL